MQNVLFLILDALRQLTIESDEHWTQAGEPALKVVEELVGDKSVSREDVKLAAPGFNRKAAEEGYDFEAAQKAVEVFLADDPTPTSGEDKQSPDNDGGEGETDVPDTPTTEEIQQAAVDVEQHIKDLEEELTQAKEGRGKIHAMLAEATPQASLQQCNAQFKQSLKRDGEE